MSYDVLDLALASFIVQWETKTMKSLILPMFQFMLRKIDNTLLQRFFQIIIISIFSRIVVTVGEVIVEKLHQIFRCSMRYVRQN